MARAQAFPFYEFFAGGGLARLGLEPGFTCVFANDHDPAKAAAYARAFGDDHLVVGDVEALPAAALPGRAALAWASFPCQDLSLAGARAGLDAPRSGAFWGFHRLMRDLADEGRAPRTICLENVVGLLTSRRGADFERLIAALDDLGYRCGALEIDAAHFVPQSRRRLFVIATQARHEGLSGLQPAAPFHSDGVRAAVARLPASLQRKMIWWRLPLPPLRNTALADMVDARETAWRSEAETAKLIGQMSALQQARLTTLRAAGGVHIGAVFRRMRIENGEKVQRAEARFDGVAGCLRTPAGGSSRQILIEVRDGRVRARLFNGREAARLMGVCDDHPIPDDRTAALHLFGDAVVAPVVRWLGEHILLPLAREAPLARDSAA
ncbi:MAG: DNA (cytosine-5-)-methyltransferase [Alphaproteobacteria bacterium]|nr:DNA (cytosine-5-)-methyltransferase [Alphaproteobacteria bacterium]